MRISKDAPPDLRAALLDQGNSLNGLQRETVRQIWPTLADMESELKRMYSSLQVQPIVAFVDIENHFSKGAELSRDLVRFLDGLAKSLEDRVLPEKGRRNLPRVKGEESEDCRFGSAYMIHAHHAAWTNQGGNRWLQPDFKNKQRKLGTLVLAHGEQLEHLKGLTNALKAMEQIASDTKERARRNKKRMLFDDEEPLWVIVRDVYDLIRYAGRAEAHVLAISWEIHKWASNWAPLELQVSLCPADGKRRGKAIFETWKLTRKDHDYSEPLCLPEVAIENS